MLWAYQMGFGTPAFHSANWTASSCGICNFFHNFVGKPGTSISSAGLESQASIPLVDAGMPPFGLPQASVVYFQFVFAAITPLLFLGSVLSRIKFKVWIVFVPLWTSWPTASTPSCSGAAVTGRSRVPATSREATSSTWPPASAVLWLPRWSGPA